MAGRKVKGCKYVPGYFVGERMYFGGGTLARLKALVQDMTKF